MMSVTHAIYARKIAEHIRLMYGINLKRYSLIYGSIKPDVSVLFSGAPHYINKSLDGLCQNAELLIESTNNVNEIETRAFSRELGVILHFITDYFCRAHNDINGRKHPTNYSHVLYEQKFQNKLKTYELDAVRENIVATLENDLEKINKTSLKEYIRYKHNRYMREAREAILI